MNKLQTVAKSMITEMVIPDELIDQINNIFFSFCRHHNIKNGTPCYRDGKIIGYNVSRYDWTMTRDLFIKQLQNKLEFSILLGEVPDDLKG